VVVHVLQDLSQVTHYPVPSTNLPLKQVKQLVSAELEQVLQLVWHIRHDPLFTYFPTSQVKQSVEVD